MNSRYSTELWTSKAIEFLETHHAHATRTELITKTTSKTGAVPPLDDAFESGTGGVGVEEVDGTKVDLGGAATGRMQAHVPPVFLYLAYNGVHDANWADPLQAPPNYVTPFATTIPCPVNQTKNNATACKDRRMLGGMVAAVDEGVGNLTRALIKHGMWNSTLLVVSTDNGGRVIKRCFAFVEKPPLAS